MQHYTKPMAGDISLFEKKPGNKISILFY